MPNEEIWKILKEYRQLLNAQRAEINELKQDNRDMAERITVLESRVIRNEQREGYYVATVN